MHTRLYKLTIWYSMLIFNVIYFGFKDYCDQHNHACTDGGHTQRHHQLCGSLGARLGLATSDG
jgi:hypothetical protein